MKARIPKKRPVFSNLYSDWIEICTDKDLIGGFLCDGYDREDITDEMIREARLTWIAEDWEEHKSMWHDRFPRTKWILFGEATKWNGVYTTTQLFYDIFSEITQDCEHWKMHDENGHLYLNCFYHDKTCRYEIKELTDKGVQYFENWKSNCNDKRDKQYVCAQIFKQYSRLARFKERINGQKRVEYVPVKRFRIGNKVFVSNPDPDRKAKYKNRKHRQFFGRVREVDNTEPRSVVSVEFENGIINQYYAEELFLAKELNNLRISEFERIFDVSINACFKGGSKK